MVVQALLEKAVRRMLMTAVAAPVKMVDCVLMEWIPSPAYARYQINMHTYAGYTLQVTVS